VTYEYICRSCNHTWEEDQKITAEPICECPSCKQQTASRLISKSTFILSGEKWESKSGY